MTQAIKTLIQQNNSTVTQVLQIQQNQDAIMHSMQQSRGDSQAPTAQHHTTPPQHMPESSTDFHPHNAYRPPSGNHSPAPQHVSAPQLELRQHSAQRTPGIGDPPRHQSHQYASQSPHTSPRGFASASSYDATDPIRISKAFGRIMASPAKKFDGKEAQEYKPWKDALHREVAGVELTPSQWMDLVEKRTSGDAYAVVQHTRVIYLETDPTFALQCVWDCLDDRFQAVKRPAQQLLADLMQGKAVSSDHPNELFLFAQDCGMAVKLQTQHPEAMIILEDQSCQDAIINRLDPRLSEKWYEHREEKGGLYAQLQFRTFADWIKR